jgi:hypothetical protein
MENVVLKIFRELLKNCDRETKCKLLSSDKFDMKNLES